ncbi:MAG: acyl-CoA thioesterase [Candidatus Roseilinea sp.]|nr:MAG: acyl-CoA thioesterase [Candidatus Roseilinea sp.]
MRSREITLRFFAQPTEQNVLGKVHGGAVMKWIDEAGAAVAIGWSGQTCVTVYVGGIRFVKPILIGSLVEVHARLIYTGRTSMHVAVDVRASDPRDGVYTQTTHCIIGYVAIDGEGRPMEVPKWEPQTPEDLALQQHAINAMALSKRIEEEMRRFMSDST